MVKLKGTGKKSPKIFKIRIKMVEKKVRPLLKKGLTKSLPVIKITGRIEAAKADTKKGDGKKNGPLQKNPLTINRKVSIIEGQDGGVAVTLRRNPKLEVRKTLWKDRDNMGRYRPEFLPLGTVIGSILVRVQYAPPFQIIVYRWSIVLSLNSAVRVVGLK